MRNLILHVFLILLMSSLVNWAGEFEYPLENQNFVYSAETLQEYIKKIADTKPIRVQQAFDQVTTKESKETFAAYFAELWLGQDLDQVNDALLNIFTSTNNEIRQKFELNDYWHLSINQQFYHMYYAFGSKGYVSAGRLYPKTEKALLEILWERMKYKDDILLARQSTWWMSGSENHDLVAKVRSLITSQIFMDEPDYKDRAYPDLGNGGGYKFWFHQMYGEDKDDGPKPRRNYKDGKNYTAADHYKEWVKYFDEYFSERAKKGFFLEVASPGYMAVSVPYLMDIFDFCKDSSLSQKAEKFIDAVWADWAVDKLNGVRGGSKTLVKDGSRWEDAMYRFAGFYFGGKGSAEAHYFTQLLTNYKLKSIIWSLALDRQGLGEFAYVSRKPGVEENKWPRPLGAERTNMPV